MTLGDASSVAFYHTLEQITKESPVISEFLANPGPTVRIHVPFSGAFDEALALHEFLAPLMPPSWQKVIVEASDIHLPAVMGYRRVSDPRFQFSSGIIDLSRQDMPICDLALGLHPQVVGYENDGWPRIIQQVVTNSKAAIFTTWLEIEHDRLVGLCKQYGCEVHSFRNPYAVSEYTGAGDCSKRFHFVVIARNCGKGPMVPHAEPPQRSLPLASSRLPSLPSQPYNQPAFVYGAQNWGSAPSTSNQYAIPSALPSGSSPSPVPMTIRHIPPKDREYSHPLQPQIVQHAAVGAVGVDQPGSARGYSSAGSSSYGAPLQYGTPLRTLAPTPTLGNSSQIAYGGYAPQPSPYASGAPMLRNYSSAYQPRIMQQHGGISTQTPYSARAIY